MDLMSRANHIYANKAHLFNGFCWQFITLLPLKQKPPLHTHLFSLNQCLLGLLTV